MTGRPVNTSTKLGALIARSGEPTYMWAAKARIAYSSLNAYTAGRQPIPHHHLVRLSEVFNVEPEDIIGVNEHAQ